MVIKTFGELHFEKRQKKIREALEKWANKEPKKILLEPKWIRFTNFKKKKFIYKKI